MSVFYLFGLLASSYATDIIRHNGAGCSAPNAVCPSASEGNCCRAPLGTLFPNRARGVRVLLTQDATTALSVPFARGDGTYCGDPIASGVAFGTSIGCYQNDLLGSALYIRCQDPPPVQDDVEDYCPNARLQLNTVETTTPPSAPNNASVFTDENGSPTDYEGYLAAVDRMDAGIREWGEAQWYLQRQTGLAPEAMRFEDESANLQSRAPFATVYTGTTRCTGESLASVETPNQCYSTNGAASFYLSSLPSRCVLEYFSSLDCSGDGTVAAVSDSYPGCYTGTNYNSIRARCTLM
ncbi:hypothetical protein KC363_g5599 [Hortaea werneckii]|nr:hypothetical protein KC361_g5980 [Hortaea werneckii]KAI6882195.1 hypothetical protein KC325_g5972 [Hortaea werneckii]KAI6990849.1 hypothetical protein KC359_g6493 [Hortaea werneckii]KAI7143908.1 hypothetical protein KC344_g5853 [Hortaea werneckii]KAI7171690.1 hypothetical protein KC360_g5994 [Hortaea werneckii]